MRRSVAALSAIALSSLIAVAATVPASAAVAAPATSVSQQEVTPVGAWKLDRAVTNMAAILAYDVPMFMDVADNYEFETRVGCNMVFGSVTFAPQDGLAKFSAVGSTQMECEQVAMDAERAIKDLLDNATLKYTLTETALVFTSETGDVVGFTR